MNIRPLASLPTSPPPRPVASTTVVQVDGGRWQGRCVCRWHGRRHADTALVSGHDRASVDAERHRVLCGLCVRNGRDYMDECSCANCERRRYFRRKPTPPTSSSPQP